MSNIWIFGFGITGLFILAAVIGRRLGPELRSRLSPTMKTVVMVWCFYAVHFGLVVLAAVRSTWPVGLPLPLAIGGGIALTATGAALYLSAT